MKNRLTVLSFAIALVIAFLWLLRSGEKLKPNLTTVVSVANTPVADKTMQPSAVASQTNITTNVSTFSKSQPKPTTLEEANAKIRQMLEARNHPVELWGRVVDQYGDSVADVKVDTEINHFFWPPEQFPNGVSTNFEIITDADGRFHVNDNSATGIHVMLRKAGYVQEERNGYGSNGQNGSQENPAILKMWKLHGHEPLNSSEINMHIPHDGTPAIFDIASGKESPNGDFEVTLSQYPLEIKHGWDRFDWSVKVEILNGGMQEENDSCPYWAPTNGYQDTFEFNESSNAVKWLGGLPQKIFYIKNGQGHYGIMKLQVFPGRSPTGIEASFTINPSGSRNLEPDFSK